MKARILPLIGLTFGLVLISRAVDVSSEVITEKPAAIMSTDMKDTKTSLEPEAPQSPTQCLTGAVLETLTTDMERLDTRKIEIAKREATLNAIQSKLDAQMKAVEAANSSLQGTINQLKSIANDDLKHLVGMYQTMKPKQAAEIFNSMDPSFAAGFLREMNSEKAGLIMANMDARKSYAISVIIAGQNAKYRKPKN